VRVLSGGQWQDASKVKTRSGDQWVDVYTAEPTTTSPSTNYVYVTESQLQAAKERVGNGDWPFTGAHNKLLNRADNALGTSLRSVVDDNGSHVYRADTNNRHDYRVSIRMSEAARDCGLAYWFTGDDKYARKTVDIIHHWALRGDKYMKPTAVIPNTPEPIEQWITIPAFFYGASFVRGHPRWDNYDGSRPWDGGNSGDAESAFAAWVRDWYSTFRAAEPSGHCVQNNKWPWRIANVAAVGAYLDDASIVDLAERMYRAEARTTCPDGSTSGRPWADNWAFNQGKYTNSPGTEAYSKAELRRSNAFSYCAYNLLALYTAKTAIEAYTGNDLSGFVAPGDDRPNSGTPSLQKLTNWFADHFPDTSGWSWNSESISWRDKTEAAAMFELARASYGGYWNQVSWNGRRPHWDHRVLGPVTLTHGAP
jgi:hypothetical protein